MVTKTFLFAIKCDACGREFGDLFPEEESAPKTFLDTESVKNVLGQYDWVSSLGMSFTVCPRCSEIYHVIQRALETYPAVQAVFEPYRQSDHTAAEDQDEEPVLPCLD